MKLSYTSLLTRRLSMLGALTALVLVTGFPIAAQAATEPTLAPQNPAFLRYIQSGPDVFQAASMDGIHPSGLVPEPITLPQPSSHSMTVQAADLLTSLPTSYDLRPLNKLTPMRDQSSCGDCWAFATMGSMESYLMPTESQNFSENNLKNNAGFDLGCCDGGNRTMSTAYLARWAGAIAESADPYSPSNCTSPAGVSPIKHVQDVIYIPTRTGALDNATLKQAVMTYGAVYTTYYHSDSYYKSSTRGYYYNGSSSANHAVCIVGWDDSYPASNFNTTAPGNGAFLIRNSWGTYWGDSGYFWMSYYDSRLGYMENAVFTAEPANNFDGIYQYDPYGWISSSGYSSNTAWFANVFTAAATSNVAAASWYCNAAGATYELRVYTNPSTGPINSAGPVSVKTGTIATAGYHTIRLDTVVPITAGQKFSVVVKLTTPGSNSPIPLERPMSGYCSRATASTGQSYMSSAGTTWSDVAASYSNTNVCLKAFTSNTGAPNPNPNPNPGSLSVTPATGLAAAGNVGGPFSPANAAYTLTNSGGSGITWTASKTQPWTTLSSTTGTLTPGATAVIAVSINSNANTLAAGNYSDTVTFTNTANGTGNTTRAVTLAVSSSPTPNPGVLSVTPTTGLSASGTAGGPFNPSTATYTLTNTGSSSLTWTAANAQAWLTLSSTGGTLNAGASAMVTASINSSANALTAGTYSDAIAFTNTTNGSGNTSRSVTISVSNPGPTPIPGGYTVAPTTYNWIDPTNHSKIWMWNNSGYGTYLPFAFNFYGKAYTTYFYVGSNGLITFASSGTTSSYNTNIPSAYAPNAGIYPYWDALDLSTGSVRMAVVGTAPSRKLVISWVNVKRAYTSSLLTFQAILCEGSSDIIFQYQNVSPTDTVYGAGRNATVGIEDATGSSACKFSYNTASLSNNFALKFTGAPALQSARFLRRSR